MQDKITHKQSSQHIQTDTYNVSYKDSYCQYKDVPPQQRVTDIAEAGAQVHTYQVEFHGLLPRSTGSASQTIIHHASF